MIDVAKRGAVHHVGRFGVSPRWEIMRAGENIDLDVRLGGFIEHVFDVSPLGGQRAVFRQT